ADRSTEDEGEQDGGHGADDGEVVAELVVEETGTGTQDVGRTETTGAGELADVGHAYASGAVDGNAGDEDGFPGREHEPAGGSHRHHDPAERGHGCGDDRQREEPEVNQLDERQVADESPGAVEPARLCFVVEALLGSGDVVEVPEPEVVADGGN